METVEILGYVSLGIIVVFLGAVGIAAAREIPQIARYVRIHRM